MAAGQIFLPAHASYLLALEDELLNFPGGDYCDQVDALCHAAMEVQKRHAVEDSAEC
jgi:phage terminase large subunit-like protein